MDVIMFFDFDNGEGFWGKLGSEVLKAWEIFRLGEGSKVLVGV